MMHQIENNMEEINPNKTFNTNDWYTLNPNSFYYEGSYVTDPGNKYTIGDTSVYFVDPYSKTFALEDRARIFERVCSNINYEDIKGNENLLKKAEFIKKTILEYYPYLKDATIFNALNN